MLWLWHITNQEDSHDNNLLQEGQLEETSFQAQPVQRHKSLSIPRNVTSLHDLLWLKRRLVP